MTQEAVARLFGVTGRMLRYRVERCRAEGVEDLRARGGRSARRRAATAGSASPAKSGPGRSASRPGLRARPCGRGRMQPAPAQGQKAQEDGRFEPAARPAFLEPLWAVPEPSARPKVQGTNRLPVPTPHQPRRLHAARCARPDPGTLAGTGGGGSAP